jgi:hypothetical protein
MTQQTVPSLPADDNALSVRDLERLVYQQQFPDAYRLILKFLNGCENRGELKFEQSLNNPKSAYLSEYTRLASALTAFFANSAVELSYANFKDLVQFKEHLLGIFQLSGFQGTNHLLDLIGNQGTNSPQFEIKTPSQLMKLLLFYALDSDIEIDFATLLKKNSELAQPTYLSLTDEKCVLNTVAATRREQLLELGSLLKNMSLQTMGDVVHLCRLWMTCSYVESATKHQIKPYLNQVWQKWLAEQGVKPPPLPVKRLKKESPVLLVASEHFRSTHAMFRCFAPWVQQLREKFQLILMSKADGMDDVSQKLFDQVIEIEQTEVKKLVGKIVKLKPDMVYYPSLGMKDWTIALANLRLAPIQFMSLGHPATSYSQAMDYCLVPEILYSVERDCFSEKVILMDTAATVQMISRHDAVAIPPQIRVKPPTIRLAITSTALKLNPSFLSVCQRILEESHRAIEFHFFPSERGIVHQVVEQRLHEWLPMAKVYPYTEYNDYINNLNQCDIQLSPFPFGGTNSNADSMKQGIPLVAMEGHEPHSRMDSIFFQLSNLPKWLLTHSQEEYIQAALRLIHADEERVAISEALLTQDFDKLFMDHEFRYHDRVVVKTVAQLYQYHEEMQKDGRKVWAKGALEQIANIS